MSEALPRKKTIGLDKEKEISEEQQNRGYARRVKELQLKNTKETRPIGYKRSPAKHTYQIITT